MHKLPLLFVFTTSIMMIIFALVAQNAFAQALELNVNQRVFSSGDTLVAFGKSVPNDALIIELFNPAGSLVLRTQIDVGVEGSFSRILMEWPVSPTEKFRFGIYSLVVQSSRNADLRATEVLSFQPSAGAAPGVERELAVQISVPAVIGKDEVAKAVIQVTMNDVLVKGDAVKTLQDSHIHFPDGSVEPIDTFTVLEDGIYLTDFNSSMLGHHTIHIQASQQGLIASSVSGVFVEEGPILSLGNEIAKLNNNIESLRQETVGKTEEISEAVSDIGNAVSDIGAAAGQLTSLLLPIIGMIAIIVALQATMLAKRK